MTDTTKHIINKLLVRLLMLLAVLAVLDIIYYFTLYKKDIDESTTLMEISQRANKGIDIVYLGESSNFSYAETDTDRRFICMMIEDSLPGHHVGNLSKGACHAGIYYDILRNIPKKSDVKTAIVTVNMRSFTSEWIYSNLETPLRKEQIMLKKAPALYKRMLLAFKAYPIWTEKERSSLIKRGFKRQTFVLPHPFPYQNANEWDHGVGYNCILYNGIQPSMDSIALACHHIKHFACTLDDKNPRIKDFDKIVKLCKKRGWQPVFNILAENVDQIDSLCGPDLLYLLEQNVKYVTDRYESQGVIVVNNLTAVRDTDFFDRDFPTEHYRQTGRQAVAKNVSETLKKRLY
ncbi:MAG: hypothetical protein J6T87_01115 [Bacteroidales bacterium]|nr:hypothetical protein [Bacteroidales bacterium]